MPLSPPTRLAAQHRSGGSLGWARAWARAWVPAGAGLLSGVLASLQAAAEPPAPLAGAQLADLSLEQLREVVVSTVSRVDERLDHVAASVYVISAEDIRRSGASTLPEALRLAPTLMVAQADGNQYAISARGFNNVLANRLLVLIDGRTVYSPLFSGVFWEAQDVLLEDVERIEVVTGPSTALWGSNAVNALVHVITSSAAAAAPAATAASAFNATGPLGVVVAGDGRRSVGLRLGGAGWRGYVKHHDSQGTRRAGGSAVGDASEGVQAGLRVDWAAGGDNFTVQGDAYQGEIPQPGLVRRFSGANLTARWARQAADGRHSNVQLVLDHTERTQQGTYSDTLETVDLVAQHGLVLGPHRLVLGGGLRQALDTFDGSALLAFYPPKRRLAWRRFFAQDQWQATPTVALTLATSVEGNPYTGTEVLPSLRLAWTGLAQGLLWASLSRAVRAPSRVDRELYSPAQPPYALAGGPDFRSEVSNVAELGWRAQSGPALSYAFTLYHAQHQRLRSLQPSAQGAQWRNGLRGHDSGLESWVRWQTGAGWRLDAGLVLNHERLQVVPGAVDAGGLATLGNPPRHQATLRSSLDLAPGWRWDADLRQVGALPAPAVPAYTAFDTRLTWTPARGSEFTLGVQNLFDPHHPEWGAAASRAEIQRSFFLRLRLWH
jgi:iron complex outermembrane receptor protein